MFEDATAWFDELMERCYPSVTPESAALVQRIGIFARVENRAAAEQLAAIGELFAYRLSRIGCRAARSARTGRSTPRPR